MAESLTIDEKVGIAHRLRKKMNTEQIQTLLEDSKEHYRKRNLKKALNAAQIALDFGLEEGAEIEELLLARLLLANIYNTNGKYQCDSSFFHKALSYLNSGDFQEESIKNSSVQVKRLLILGQIYQNLAQFEEARNYFNWSFELSQKTSDTAGIVRSLARLSQNSILVKDYEKAHQYAEDGLTFLQSSDQAKNEYLLSEVYSQLSEILIWRKEYSKSLEVSQTLLTLSKNIGDIEKEVAALKNIAVVCGVKSNYKIGMQYFLEALDRSEDIGYRHQIAQILINIGTIYAHLYNYDEAIKRYEEVLEDYEDILDNKNRVVIYNNLGNIYYTQEKAEIARSYFEKSFKLALDSDYREMIAHSLAQLSRTDLQSNNFERATEYARKAQVLIEELGNINGRQINLLNLATIQVKNGDYKKAITLTEQGIEAAKSMKDDASEIRGYKMLAEFYKEKGDYKKALDYQIIYSRIQEEFAKVQRNRQFLDMEIRHAIREKQREIEQLTRENEYQALLLEKTDQIARQNQELISANEELRQFAYVASHDLKEPLRMIGSYTQIVNRLIGKHLDEDGQLFFHYITDGVERMNALLDALLKYATVGKSEEPIEMLDLNQILEISQFNLKVRIDENQAIIHRKDLPKVRGTKTLYIQLFQNLIGNAIKFRRKDVIPEIWIDSKKNESEYIISIKDNGIGIADEFKARIFEIFQRLHTRNKYEGTGIGLAICLKIVKRLGGRIWVESTEGEGATFFFSIPR